MFNNFFKKKPITKRMKHFSSNFGRSITSIDTAKDELYHKPQEYNPYDYITTDDKEFFGATYDNNAKKYIPMYIPKKAINHKLYVGYTRSGKGIIIGNKVVESLINKRGAIYVDVKQEDFTPQIIKEELERQNRPDDFLIVNYPNDFGYSGFNDDDTVIEMWEKISVALEFEKSTDPAVEHYRSNQRMTLLKVLEVLYNPSKEATKNNPKDWYFFMEYVRCLHDDLKSYKQLQDELQKSQPNQNRIEKLSNMYFTTELLEELQFNIKNIAALEMIYMKTFELLLNANIYTKHSIKEALYNGKVLYLKCDMENMSSLQMLKMLYIDISQTVRKEKAKGIIANCDAYFDEISFYVSKRLSGGLSTLAGFGVSCSLLLQDLSQIEDASIRNAILSNCTVKLFYKISDAETLDYVKKLGGEEVVTKYSKRNLEDTFAQDLEPLLNTTRIRAMWFQQHAIMIAEYLNTAVFIETDFVKVSKPFDWSSLDAEIIETEKYTFKKSDIKIYKEMDLAADKLTSNTNIDEDILQVLANTNEDDLSDF
jgi:hypothetical protein